MESSAGDCGGASSWTFPRSLLVKLNGFTFSVLKYFPSGRSAWKNIRASSEVKKSIKYSLDEFQCDELRDPINWLMNGTRNLWVHVRITLSPPHPSWQASRQIKTTKAYANERDVDWFNGIEEIVVECVVSTLHERFREMKVRQSSAGLRDTFAHLKVSGIREASDLFPPPFVLLIKCDVISGKRSEWRVRKIFEATRRKMRRQKASRSILSVASNLRPSSYRSKAFFGEEDFPWHLINSL